MILQLMIKRPDADLSQSILVGIRHSKQTCLELIKMLMEDKVNKEIASLGFSFFPEGFTIEGVAYGEIEEEPIDAYDLNLKVLH